MEVLDRLKEQVTGFLFDMGKTAYISLISFSETAEMFLLKLSKTI